MKTLRLRTGFVMTCALTLTLLSGCASRVVYVKSGDPVRIAEPVKAHVWVPDASGKMIRSQNRIVIPEGWYALPRN